MSGALAAMPGTQMGLIDLPTSMTSDLNESGGAEFELTNDGNWEAIGANGVWCATRSGAAAGTVIAADYQARASNLAGDTADATGTFDTWLDLSTTRSWGVFGTNKLVTFTVEIRGKNHRHVYTSCNLSCGTAS